ncbi:Crp/Fnr family transcriptional regulator [Gloeocapsopsis dulcis]|uniref:Crp/Fnr family transcriptional regulator n=1 Tax=Gloeocapsopsis dulcis AAB1 = 1H9 TaxID=1433147 RepID=A0A6N8FY19_9CHRO|nr:Crp/Fnr family transcriptional regulator [Gloeocapsopsis dulcis]MUL36806.1 Crp/Fnr family transcriptional regulator [Gloeocapsopsis dulcis AAB1 = 1H9]WNN88588.1 Crp/Fnr family transcriptional regulator [Gloeocapsopsis dulcis]
MCENLNRHGNRLLAALPAEDYQRLAPHLENVSLPFQRVLHNAGEVIFDVYFPTTAMISAISIMQDGSTIEIGIIGKEGIVGMPVCWGDDTAVHQTVVQIPGNVLKMKAEVLKEEFYRGGALQKLMLRYTQALYTQVGQSAACNRLHTLEERLSRWLLTVSDRTASEELPLTQEFIAQMLGTRRSGVTVAASRLSRAGMIRYSRGKINIINREILELTACECYQVIRKDFQRLLGARDD